MISETNFFVSTLWSILIWVVVHVVGSYQGDECRHLYHQLNKKCLAEGVEIFPNLNDEVIEETKSIEDCKKLCTDKKNCTFYSYISKELRCIIKPSIDEKGPRQMLTVIRPDVVSGVVTCSHSSQCVNLLEVHPGCGAATPYLCHNLKNEGKVFFDPKCVDSTDVNCNVKGYQCCRKCSSNETDCCKGFDELQVVYSSDHLIENHSHTIENPQHCMTLCLLNPACVEWNYKANDSVDKGYGSCNLYDTILHLADTTKFSSSVGRKSCEPKQLRKKPCLFEARCRDNDLAETSYQMTMGKCQNWCQRSPVCTGIDFFPVDSTGLGECHLKFGDPRPVKGSNKICLIGPRSCDPSFPEPNLPCFKAGKFLKSFGMVNSGEVTAEKCYESAKLKNAPSVTINPYYYGSRPVKYTCAYPVTIETESRTSFIASTDCDWSVPYREN